MEGTGKSLRVFFHPGSPAAIYRQPRSLVYAITARALNATLRLTGRFRRGNGANCAICGWSGSVFGYAAAVTNARLGRNEICLGCGSNPRTRVLIELLLQYCEIQLETALTVADVGAARCTRLFFNQYPHVKYRVVDRYKHADIHSDATQISLPDESVDIVLCCHVIEHVDDHLAAIAELHRILKPSGVGLIAVPQTQGLSLSRRTGQKCMDGYGHVWEFGDDFSDMLRNAGFHAQILQPKVADDCGNLPFHLVSKRPVAIAAGSPPRL